MTDVDISARRLHRQHVGAAAVLERPEDVVRSLLAVQAQDYPNALWAIGLRTTAAGESDVERALADRRIVRTWPMRGTLHIVAAPDVKWMLRLLTPRVIASRRRLIDDGVVAQSRRLIERALEGGRALTRAEAYDLLEANGISPAGQRGYHVLAMLAQKGVICFGPRRGKQHTFVLLDEWIQDDRRLTRQESLAELALRYFRSRGPATVYDLAAWSGLTIGDVRLAIELAGAELERVQMENVIYYDAAPTGPIEPDPDVHLLPAFDETLCGYRDRSVFVPPDRSGKLILKNGIMSPTIVHLAGVKGAWKRAVQKDRLVINGTFFDNEQVPLESLERSAHRYRAFVGVRDLELRVEAAV